MVPISATIAPPTTTPAAVPGEAAHDALAGAERVRAQHRERAEHDPERVLDARHARDEHGEAEARRPAHAVVQPDRVRLEVRDRPLLGGRDGARQAGRASPEHPPEPAAPVGGGGDLGVLGDLGRRERELLRAEARDREPTRPRWRRRRSAAGRPSWRSRRGSARREARRARRVSAVASRDRPLRAGRLRGRERSPPHDLTAQTAPVRRAVPAGRTGDCATIASSQAISSTRRTTARAAVLSPVGRYGVARNVRWSAAVAAEARSTASS